LAAHNQEGQSNYSQIAVYRTLPDRPDPPAKPRIKGTIQATQCRIAWGRDRHARQTFSTTNISLDSPRDNGGAEIQQYHLELEESKGKK